MNCAQANEHASSTIAGEVFTRDWTM
jgi:hypothetical protein